MAPATAVSRERFGNTLARRFISQNIKQLDSCRAEPLGNRSFCAAHELVAKFRVMLAQRTYLTAIDCHGNRGNDGPGSQSETVWSLSLVRRPLQSRATKKAAHERCFEAAGRISRSI